MAKPMKSIIIAGVLLAATYGTMTLFGDKLTIIKTKIFGEAEAPPVREPEAEEKTARETLASGLKGELVFDSKGKGTFGIFAVDIATGEKRKIFDGEKQDMYPDVSPDGSKIVFAQAEDLGRDADSEVWIVNRDGSGERKLAEGTYPTFSKDGSFVLYEVKRSRVMKVSLDGSDPEQVFPPQGSPFEGKKIVKPRMSFDSKKLLFTSDVGGRWTAWAVDLESQQPTQVGKGCEPVFFEQGNSVAWVTKKNVLAKSAIGKKNLSSDQVILIQDDGPPFGHEYFPTMVQGDKFLLYAACPAGQHSHLEANYQLFVKDMAAGETVRVTFDGNTNRWPKFLPAN